METLGSWVEGSRFGASGVVCVEVCLGLRSLAMLCSGFAGSTELLELVFTMLTLQTLLKRLYKITYIGFL